MNIFFTSDTHYGHKNIVKGTSTWTDNGGIHGAQSTRDFDTVAEHNLALVDSINQMVKEDDVLYHLGDWSFGGHENIKLFRDQLKCKNIHLILGNHDQWIEPLNSPYRALFASVNQRLQFSLKIDATKSGKMGRQGFFLSHYSHQVWDKSNHGCIHLFGHSHGSLKGIGKSMDVGVDTNNLYPYHLDEILDIMKNIKTEIIDHHNSNTN